MKLMSTDRAYRVISHHKYRRAARINRGLLAIRHPGAVYDVHQAQRGRWHWRVIRYDPPKDAGLA